MSAYTNDTQTYQSPHQDHLHHSGTHGTEPSSALLCLQEHTSADYIKDKLKLKQDKQNQEQGKILSVSIAITFLLVSQSAFNLQYYLLQMNVHQQRQVHSYIYQSSNQQATKNATRIVWIGLGNKCILNTVFDPIIQIAKCIQ